MGEIASLADRRQWRYEKSPRKQFTASPMENIRKKLYIKFRGSDNGNSHLL